MAPDPRLFTELFTELVGSRLETPDSDFEDDEDEDESSDEDEEGDDWDEDDEDEEVWQVSEVAPLLDFARFTCLHWPRSSSAQQ